MNNADLVTKLEEAEEGSRQLDYTIRMVLAGYEPVSADTARRADEDGGDPAPHYTTNLQDAVDLVPENYSWALTMHPYDRTGWRKERVDWNCIAQVYLLSDEDASVPYSSGYIEAQTPAIALCIAVIKAKDNG